MAADKAFESMDELAEELTSKLRDLKKGKIATEELEVLCEQARELYERLVVIRHKGREASMNGQEQVDLRADDASELPEIRLDLDGPVQTSLIDAIAETEDDDSVPERVATNSITDLSKAIGLNQKFMFISQLFAGDKNKYAETIDRLNGAEDRSAALEMAESVVASASDDEEGQLAKERFLDLIERRFQ